MLEFKPRSLWRQKLCFFQYTDSHPPHFQIWNKNTEITEVSAIEFPPIWDMHIWDMPNINSTGPLREFTSVT